MLCFDHGLKWESKAWSGLLFGPCRWDNMKKFIAELMGTFVLVFGGVGSAVLAGDKIGYTGISLAWPDLRMPH
jgi:hypothetical protein